MPDQKHPWENDEYIIRAAFNSLQKRVSNTRNELLTHQGIPKSVFDKLDYEERRIEEVREKLILKAKKKSEKV